jgi:hypothetical protein
MSWTWESDRPEEKSHRNLRPYAERTQYFLIPVNSCPERSSEKKTERRMIRPAIPPAAPSHCSISRCN